MNTVQSNNMISKVILLILGVIILGDRLKGISENEFAVVSTSQRPDDATNNKTLEMISKLEETDRHFTTQMKDLAQMNQRHTESTNEKLVQFAAKLQQLEKLNTSLDEKDRTISQMRRQLQRQEKTIEEQRKSLVKIEQKLERETEKLFRLEGDLHDYKTRNQRSIPRNCKETKDRGNDLSGVYLVQPKSESFNVYCNMHTNGGGWTVFQNRFDGSEDFFRNWTDYKRGFGNLNGEFWLGLQHLHELTETGSNELLIQLVDRNSAEAFASYNDFRVDTEEKSYSIKTLSSYTGTAGDAFTEHLRFKFSTSDRDNSERSCPSIYKSGWWFRKKPWICMASNLNGKYSQDGTLESGGQGLNWGNFSTRSYGLLKSKMMIR